ncbi:hybrid sensor histidine kinase/response regulator [Halodesulfurarchaeum sp.]|uniref:hybrid sensor histidine kinase/response regulator n=1 Tax=Halodesulfurarchaeum sp. TaxID=1980530 RepID=UPI002FC38DEE
MNTKPDTIRVLHVEDDPDLADLASTFLAREDDRFDIETAHNAAEGLDRLVETDFDCIVSDYDMPGQNGIQFLETVREEYPDLPFILYTGKGSEEVASEAISTGVTDYLQKGSGTDQYTLLANRVKNAVRQYRTRSKLEESEQRYRHIVERSPNGIFIVKNGQIEFVNQTVVEWLDVDSGNELVGESITEFVHPDTIPTVQSHIEALRNGQEVGWERGKLLTETEETKHVKVHGRPIIYHGEDAFQVVANDVSLPIRRKQALGDLHDVTRDLMQLRTPDEIHECVGTAAGSVLGLPLVHIYIRDEESEKLVPVYTSEEVEGTFGDLPSFERGEGLLWHVLEQGETVAYDDVQTEGDLASDLPIRGAIIAPLGEYGVLGIASLSPESFNRFDKKLASILASQAEVAFDRGTREQELKRQNYRLDEFTSIVSHDLRNPLNVAEGRLKLAREECDSDHLDDVDRALERMNDLIDDLLTLAREGEQVGEREPVDLAGLTETCWQNVAIADATLMTDIDGRIHADKSRLQQLLENLLRNAVEHSGNDVTIRIGDLDDGFYVADDGPGIPEEDRTEIFESGYSTSDEGTGFGLAIVQQIVDAHDWEIRVTESEAGGAWFEVTNIESAD